MQGCPVKYLKHLIFQGDAEHKQNRSVGVQRLLISVEETWLPVVQKLPHVPPLCCLSHWRQGLCTGARQLWE